MSRLLSTFFLMVLSVICGLVGCGMFCLLSLPYGWVLFIVCFLAIGYLLVYFYRRKYPHGSVGYMKV